MSMAPLPSANSHAGQLHHRIRPGDPIINEFAEGRVKGVQTHQKTHFLLLAILLRVAARFQIYLKQIDRLSLATETQLHRSMQNKELFQLLGLEKSLVYFFHLAQIQRADTGEDTPRPVIKLYEEDQDLLEDVLIEIKQAIEMCNIYWESCPAPWMPLPRSSPTISTS